MAKMYNPVSVSIKMKKVENNDNVYFVGNCDMDISLLDTVIRFIPPREGDRYCNLVINNTKEHMQPENSQGADPKTNDDE